MSDKKNFRIKPYSKRVEKPWGHEIIFTHPKAKRTGKILFVKARRRLSLQYHNQKEETLCLFSGQAIIWLEDKKGKINKIAMKKQKGYFINRFQKHRVEAISDSYIFEISGLEAGTTFRIEDDYHRKNEKL